LDLGDQKIKLFLFTTTREVKFEKRRQCIVSKYNPMGIGGGIIKTFSIPVEQLPSNGVNPKMAGLKIHQICVGRQATIHGPATTTVGEAV